MSEQVPSTGATSAGTAHHPVFHKFPPWEGIVPEGFAVNFLGVKQRLHYWKPNLDNPPQYPANRRVKAEYPPFDAQYFEWIAVLESVINAKNHFTMIELGAGLGLWTADAWAALKQFSGLPCSLVTVEAEPTHFKFMSQLFADNLIDPQSVCMIEAAVTKADGKVGFYFGTEQGSGEWDQYDQSIGGSHIVQAVSLRTLLKPLATVDLIHVDIQGLEYEVLEAAANELDEKVKRVYVETHKAHIERSLRSLFRRLGWDSVHDCPGWSTVQTEFGKIAFVGGGQTWLNPTFSNSPENEKAVLRQKLESSRHEGARLLAELQTREAEMNQAALMSTSLGWRLIERGRRLRDWIAPSGSRRRRMYEFVRRRI